MLLENTNRFDAQGGLMSEKSLAKGMMKLRDHSVQATKNWATPARWATPIARDAKHENAASNYPTNSKLGLQAPRSTINGDLSQLTLNPLFTEWLMGLPIGWTECEPVGMAWCRWLAAYAITVLGAGIDFTKIRD